MITCVCLLDNSTKGPGRDFVNFSLVLVIRRWSPAQELSIEASYGAWDFLKILKNTGWKKSILRVVEGGRMSGCPSVCLFVSCCWFLVILVFFF